MFIFITFFLTYIFQLILIFLHFTKKKSAARVVLSIILCKITNFLTKFIYLFIYLYLILTF
jgi:hypothetical protein